MSKTKDSVQAMTGFKRVEPEDSFMEKYGFHTGEVCSDYDTLKKATAIKKDPKKMAAIKQYAEEEIDSAGDVASEMNDVEAKTAEKKPNSGKEVYNDSKDEIE